MKLTMSLCMLFFALMLATERSPGWRQIAGIGLAASGVWLLIETRKID